MSQAEQPIVVIGSGLAGYNFVKELRKLDADTNIIVITADDGRFYSKPMLSTGFGKQKSADDLATATAADMADQLNIEVRTQTRVTHIDSDSHQIIIGDELLSYSKLVLALGAEVIRPRIEGTAASETYSINDLQDYAVFRKAVDQKKRVLIMGAGLIGCEFANDLASGEYDVTVVAPSEQVLPSMLPHDAATALQQGLESLGTRFYLGPLVSRIDHSEDGLSATLSTGETIATDVVISAIGLRPRLELAVKAGLQVNQGIIADRTLKTSADDIYVLGDCAEVEGNVLLYVLPLMASARALAKTIAGTETKVSYGVMPVTIKTPVLPTVVALPKDTKNGSWHIENDDGNVEAQYRDENGDLLGYALTGTKVKNKVALNKELPALLP